MTNEQQDLWRRITAFEIDRPDAALPFSRRLARENGWSPTYTRRVLDEYRRFLFLAVAAGHPVSPSEDVDAAWHLHLLYTESYWTDLCQETLGRPVHHGPTRGGAEEAAKFVDWYAHTRDSYRRHFGEEPPEDVWPAAMHQRPGPVTHWTLRVPKPRLIGWRTAVVCAAPLALLLCGAADSSNDNDLLALTLLVGAAMAVLVIAIRAAGDGRGRQGPGGAGGASGGGCGGGEFIAGQHGGGGDGDGSSGDSGCGSSGCGGGCGGGGD